MADSIEPNKKYAVKAKRGAKFWSFGFLSLNQWNHWSIGIKNTPELRELLANTPEGKHVYFSIFEDNQQREHTKAKQDGYAPAVADLNDDIPFN